MYASAYSEIIGEKMVKRNPTNQAGLLEHYIGQAVLSARLTFEQSGNGEIRRKVLIKTLDEEGKLRGYKPAEDVIVYLREHSWDSVDKLEEFDKWYGKKYGQKTMQDVSDVVAKLFPKA